MKTYFNIILLSACISLPVAANSDEQAITATHTNSAGMMDHHTMMMSSNGSMNMMDMQPKMQEMAALMQQIVHEDNMEKRKVLLTEHMKKMQENMQIINETMGSKAANGEPQNSQMMPTDERMKMLEGRLNMMQEIMAQMMSHNAQSEMRPKQTHKVNQP